LVTRERIAPAGEHGSVLARAFWRNGADQIYAAMEPSQPSGVHPALHLCGAHPQAHELRVRDHPVLPRSHPGDP
jgi:hypothetical protein